MTLRYGATASLMGLVWYLALLISPDTRGFLLSRWNRSISMAPLPGIESVVVMCLASLGVAWSCHRWIVQAKGWQHVVLGVILPFYGCVLFLCGLIVVRALHSWRLADLVHYDNLSLLFWGLLMTASSAYVVIPMGWLSQWVMSRSGRVAVSHHD